MDIHADLVYSHTRYEIASYFRSAVSAHKPAQNAIFDGFGSNLTGAVFCLAQPIGGLLVKRRLIVTVWRQLEAPNGG